MFPGNCRASVWQGIYPCVTEKDAIQIDNICKPNNHDLITMFTVKDIGTECFIKLQELGWEDVVSYKGAYAEYPMTMMVKANPWVEPMPREPKVKPISTAKGPF